MALINCPECEKQVSDRAATCPNCGVGITTARETQAAGQHIQTMQKTSKKLKMHLLMAALASVLGLLLMLIASTSASADFQMTGFAFGLLLAISGTVWLIGTRFRIWWHHD